MDSNTKLSVDDTDPCAQLSQQAALMPNASQYTCDPEKLDRPKRKTRNFVKVLIFILYNQFRSILYKFLSGEVVAVTGDGTNGAPALHEADIGHSMGIQGTEVAKESSDIITLDDYFASVLKMTVVEAYVGKQKMDLTENSSELHSEVKSLLCEGVALNSSGNVHVPKDGGEAEVSGSPTEEAILSWALKLGMKFDVIKSNSKVLHVFPFNSEKKRVGVAVQTANSEVHIHWKGAAEIVLSSCTRYIDANNGLQSIDNDKEFFKTAIDDMAERRLRCVAIAYRSSKYDKVPPDEEGLNQWVLPEDELILLAIVGIKDPLRPGVNDAVRVCTTAGVKVPTVTGDYIQTAKAIALDCGILGSNEDAVERSYCQESDGVFQAYSEKEREVIAKKIDVLQVMGRSSPNEKLLLVQALHKVVAVTGDGTNYAPALHEADIGLSMGILGTEVAKESSNIIILDDNFASVVKVVRWGRSVYADIQKFFQFQLTVNAAALVISVVSAISSGDVPLNAVQLLWANLIMDTLGALALAREPPTDSLMQRSPVGRREPLIANLMWRNLLIQAFYKVTVLLVLNFKGKSVLHLENETREHATDVQNTMIFIVFVLFQVFYEFNARNPDEANISSGVTKNSLFVGFVGLTFILQAKDLFKFPGKQQIGPNTKLDVDDKGWHDLHCSQDSDPFDIAAMKKCPRETLKRRRLTASKVAAFIICLILCLHGAYVNALQSEPPVKEVDTVRPAQVLPRKLVLQANATGPTQVQKQPPLIDSTTLARLIIIVAPSLGLMIVVAIFCRRKQNNEPAADAADLVRPNVTYNFSIIGSLFSAA